jgi:hypothetical protein
MGREGRMTIMGEPIIIWPPDSGNYDYGDVDTGTCQGELGGGFVDCTDYFSWDDTGLFCCEL